MDVKQRLVCEREACRYLGVSRSFLARSRMEGTLPGRTPGPSFIKLGTAVRYDLADLDRWIEQNRFELNASSTRRLER